MIWRDFYSAWQARIPARMPEESLRQWNAYVSGLPADLATKALDVLTERYYSERARTGSIAAPTLWQYRKAVESIYAETARPGAPNRCDVCDGEGMVVVLDRVPGKEFPPDPDDDLPRRTLCAAPCPVCSGDRYPNDWLRDRVRRFCRSNSRRNELFEKNRNANE